jgi:dipeptidyl aminopeptidase/acylaminoacyl peptidase
MVSCYADDRFPMKVDKMKQFLVIVITVILALVLLSLAGFYLAIRPIRLISRVTPENFGVPYQKISFRTQDGVQLQGWYIPCSDPHAKTIILLHGYPADKGDLLPSRIFLHEKYNLLFFDFRYFGQSGGWYTTIGTDEVLDLKAAIQYLHSRGINEVGVWGFSLGGAVALMAAPTTPEIKAIVSESSYARLDWMAYDYYPFPGLRYVLGELTRLWGIIFLHYDIKNVSPVDAAEKITIPVLLIHSKNDETISFRNALALQEALKHDTQLEVMFVGDSFHGEPVRNYQNVVNDFFERYLVHAKRK